MRHGTEIRGWSVADRRNRGRAFPTAGRPRPGRGAVERGSQLRKPERCGAADLEMGTVEQGHAHVLDRRDARDVRRVRPRHDRGCRTERGDHEHESRSRRENPPPPAPLLAPVCDPLYGGRPGRALDERCERVFEVDHARSSSGASIVCRCAGIVEATRHGSGRDAERRRDLGLGQPRDVAERDELALTREAAHGRSATAQCRSRAGVRPAPRASAPVLAVEPTGATGCAQR